MLRPLRAPACAALVVLVAAGCQDYNFNPVGRCLMQPGGNQFTLSSVSTADVLFVVDESGSMGEEQGALATNFDRFITSLDTTNANRASGGLQPVDFHIAVTTSSVFWNFETTQVCRSDCVGAGGRRVCCNGQTPVRQPRRCTSNSQCPASTSCRLNCSGRQGELFCCADNGTIPPSAIVDLVPCSREGIMCGTMETHYDFRGCTSPTSSDEWPYPQGAFVSRSSSGVGGRFLGKPGPRVLHFDKELYPNPPNPLATNRQGFTSSELIALFKENIQVGVCGSGQEQALQGGRLAVQKALAGQQRDTYDASGALAWTAPTPTALPGSAPARWPNPNSKLVVVFVGDEDDCSSPADPSGGVVMLAEPPNADACTRDEGVTAPLGGKQFPISEFVGFFTGLGRPVGAAFIFPAAQNQCTLGTCTTGALCGTAQARGHRLLRAAEALAAAGVDVVAGSICDPDFGALLEQIAEIVKPPQTLTLPTEPAESAISLLRIASPNGSTRKLCGRALAPGAYASVAEAQATGEDWWFTETADPGVPVRISRYVYINPNGSCRANPGETYSAEYLGVVPEGGCTDTQECADKLGGQLSAWDCYKPLGPTERGTCLCKTSP